MAGDGRNGHDLQARFPAAPLGPQAALRRAMLREVERLTRRELLKHGGRLAAATGAAGALLAARFPLAAGAQDSTPTAEVPEVTSIPENLKGSGEVTVCSYGGAFQDAQRGAFFEPFQRLSGITVKEAEGPDVSKVKAMVDTGNIEWDVVELDRSSVINLERKGDYWEAIDYSLFDTANIDEARRYKYAVDIISYGQVLGYRTDVFSAAPQGWQDFWDTAKFPGPRTLNCGCSGLYPFLEAALIADGVPKDEVYPIDIERGYASLSRVRDAVATWWEAGAQPAQMLTDKEAVLADIWTGRVADLKAHGVPIEVQWSGGMFATDVWAIPKGTPNEENAMKLAAFSTLPEPQARFSMLIPNGFVNNKAAELVSPERLKLLPSAPEIHRQMFDLNGQWWADNADAVLDRWNEWILE